MFPPRTDQTPLGSWTRRTLTFGRRLTIMMIACVFLVVLHIETSVVETFPMPPVSSKSTFPTASRHLALRMTAENNNNNNNNTCHFDKQDDTDCYVFDYEAAATHYRETCEQALAEKQRFWEAYEKQNQARKRFGLAALTKEEYVVLQAETKAMGERLSQDAIAQAFRQFDTNGDGVVSKKELDEGIRDILRQELVTDDHVEAVMQHLDVSGDGVLQPDEFVALSELRRRLEEVIREEEKQLSLEAREQRQAQAQQPGLLKSFLAAFRLTDEHVCETNFDCVQPEVCCDFHFKKFCCSSGERARQLELQYATVPVPQGIEDL